MNVYVVILQPGSEAAGKVNAIYGAQSHSIVADSVWAVADSRGTCADVCDRLGIGKELSGVVVKVNEYYGMYDPALWQRIAAWQGIAA